MIIYEFKVKTKPQQCQAIDEAIRTSQFIQNKCLGYWMEHQKVSKYDLNKYCQVLAKKFSFASELNSMARQSAAERAWSAISRFYDNCQEKVKGKKGFPKFPFRRNATQRSSCANKKHTRSSVEYKTSGWKLSESRKTITFSDKKNIGTLKLKGTYDWNYSQLDQIKRVRIVRYANGYYVQFGIKTDLRIETQPTGKAISLNVGIKYFGADNNGKTLENPQFYRKSEKQLNRANRQKSKKFRKGTKLQSNNYPKARNRYAQKHLKVSRQPKEYAKIRGAVSLATYAYGVIQSNDLIRYVDAERRAEGRLIMLKAWYEMEN